MSASITQQARYFRDRMRKERAPLSAEVLADNVRRHLTLDFSIDEAINSLIRDKCSQVLRERDHLGRMFYPCEWVNGRIARWQHRDEITLAGWQLNLDERVEQAETDKKARRRVAIIVEVLAQAKQDSGNEMGFAECESEIMRRWEKAKVAP